MIAAKSYFGNLGAASGLVELIASLSAFEHGRLFPVLNYETPDPACQLNVVTAADVPPGDTRAEPQLHAARPGQRRFGAGLPGLSGPLRLNHAVWFDSPLRSVRALTDFFALGGVFYDFADFMLAKGQLLSILGRTIACPALILAGLVVEVSFKF